MFFEAWLKSEVSSQKSVERLSEQTVCRMDPASTIGPILGKENKQAARAGNHIGRRHAVPLLAIPATGLSLWMRGLSNIMPGLSIDLFRQSGIIDPDEFSIALQP